MQGQCDSFMVSLGSLVLSFCGSEVLSSFSRDPGWELCSHHPVLIPRSILF